MSYAALRRLAEDRRATVRWAMRSSDDGLRFRVQVQLHDRAGARPVFTKLFPAETPPGAALDETAALALDYVATIANYGGLPKAARTRP